MCWSDLQIRWASALLNMMLHRHFCASTITAHHRTHTLTSQHLHVLYDQWTFNTTCM